MPLFLLTLVGLLICYGSLYPFEFRPPPPDSWELLLSNWNLFTSRGDVLGNTLLFVPFGLAGFVALRPRRSPTAAALLTLMLAVALAFGAQIAQMWTPQRDPALADVLWNLVGSALGIALARPLLARLGMPADPRERGIAMTLLALWIGAELVPLVPSLDAQLLKDNLRAALAGPFFSLAPFAPRVALAMLAAELLHRLGPPLSSSVALAALLGGVALLRVFMVDADMALSIPLGLALGAVLWLSIARLRSRQRAGLIVLALVLGYTIEALAPFRFRDMPAAFSWLPFATLLEGSMLTNLRAMLMIVTMAAGCFHLLRAIGVRLLAPTLMLAVWVLLLELLQTSIATRSADVTPALLVLGVGWMTALLPRVEPHRAASRPGDGEAAASAAKRATLQPERIGVDRRSRPFSHEPIGPTPTPASTDTRSAAAAPAQARRLGRFWRSALLRSAIAAAAIAAAIRLMLALPGIPYNVLELFRSNGNFFVLLLFAFALLWIGIGARWLAAVLARTRHPGLFLALGAMVASLISLTLLWSSANTESMNDLTGSPDLYRAVTQDFIWGSAMSRLFLLSNAVEAIGFVERCVRYAALYAPLPILLACPIALRERLRSRSSGAGAWLAGLAVGALLTLWLSEKVAFAWASTDNLTELIADSTALGLSGGFYLYLLLVLVCASALAVAWAAQRSKTTGATVAVMVLLAVLPGWWLLNLGLDPVIEKYGEIFSGVQFLLGPDRTHLLSMEQLLARWSVVQLGGVAILTIGIWLGRAGETGQPWPRQPLAAGSQTQWLPRAVRRRRGGDPYA